MEREEAALTSRSTDLAEASVGERPACPHCVVAYCEQRREQITYARFIAQGYPMGSGIVESANQLVVAARLKGSGRHWARANVTPLLGLGNVACNDRWGQAWPRISGAVRRPAAPQRGEQQRQHHAARRAARPAPMPAPMRLPAAVARWGAPRR
ncbi:MAG: hypothetical protein HY689_02800 [Chloroflexi bacterium]|nr:hypothetical protein [Chloroflexota bacterium]